jgi:hypothetical protein
MRGNSRINLVHQIKAGKPGSHCRRHGAAVAVVLGEMYRRKKDCWVKPIARRATPDGEAI